MLSALDTFHFLRPVWLLLIPLGWLLAWWLRRAGGALQAWRQIVDAELLEFLTVGDGKGGAGRWILVFAVAWTVASIAVAGPSFREKPSGLFKQVQATVVVFDLSRSMLATDLTPNRLEQARYKLIDLLDAAEEGQFGLVAFAGEPFLVSPLTDDTNTITNLVSALSPDIMPARGSDPVAAMRMAAELIREVGPVGSILMITDGASDRSIRQASELAEGGISVSVLGVGTTDGAPIPVGESGVLRDASGSIVVPALEESMLKRLAAAGNGIYTRLTPDSTDLERLGSIAASDGRYDTTDTDRLRWQDEGPWLVLVLLPLAAFAFRRGVLLVFLAMAFLPPVSKAAAWQSAWKNAEQRAEQALQEERYADAARLSDDPMRKGMALYRGGQYEAAGEAFAAAAGPDAAYNLGNALAMQEQYEEAIAAYDNALAQDPEMEDAAHNKKVIEDLLKQQQEQEQQQQDQDQQNQEQESSDSEEQQSESEGEPQENEEPSEEQQQQSEQGEEEGEKEQQEMQLSEEELDDEQKQALEQWLRRIPDDPGGLLRRKFLLEYQRRGAPRNNDEEW